MMDDKWVAAITAACLAAVVGMFMMARGCVQNEEQLRANYMVECIKRSTALECREGWNRQ